jgi:hypothetical protein
MTFLLFKVGSSIKGRLSDYSFVYTLMEVLRFLVRPFDLIELPAKIPFEYFQILTAKLVPLSELRLGEPDGFVLT